METPRAASYLRPRARQRWICRSPRGSFFVLFLLSFAVRIALLPFAPLDPVWQTHWEVGAVAHNLATTGEYGNPYLVPTGPSAHTTPFYTGLMALIFWLFGVTMAAEYVRCLLIIISYSAMYALLPWLAERLGAGVRAGLVGGAIGALSPLHVPLGVDSGWDEQYAAMALGLLMVASLARWTSNHRSATGSLLLGFGWGAAFHASPPLLLVMLGCIAFELCWLRARPSWRLLAAVLLGVVAACAPWTWRNYATFHEIFFIRSNFGLELRMGNHDGASADIEITDRRAPGLHPRTHREEAEKVRSWGEMEYMRRARAEALDWIRHNPDQFLRLSALRLAHFWCGSLHRPLTVAGTSLLTILSLLGLWRLWPGLSGPQRAALGIPLVTYPLVYYLVSYMPRYRVPIDWILLILAGAAILGPIFPKPRRDASREP